MCLNGPWSFAFDNQAEYNQPAEVPAWPLEIRVPFAPETMASGIADTGFHPRCWYKRTFSYEKDPANPRLILHFGAVDYEARVWLNGHFLGEHRGGHTPFWFDASHAALNGVNTLIVRADDDPGDLAKPRGKQDWQLEPHSIWYPRTSGIWQTVWLERAADVYIHRMSWTPLLERWEIGAEFFIGGPRRDSLRLRVRLSVKDKLLADDTYQVINREVHRRIALSDPGIDDFRNELLWSPESPTLIDATVELLDGDRVIDRVVSYTALRSVSVQRGRFLLNGRP
ncbi:MAG: glycoside hydrolase family 2, partial [Proteobacteria bacterium]